MDTAFSWATVGLYNTFTRSMNIAKGRGIDFNFADGMICDWKKGNIGCWGISHT